MDAADSAIREISAEFLKYLIGAVFTGVGWLIRSVRKARKDLNKAHEKIRSLEFRVEDLEDLTIKLGEERASLSDRYP